MFLRGATPKGDVLARVMKIMPTAIEGERTQNKIGVPAGMFGQAHLRAQHRAVHDVENIHAGEVVASPAEKPGDATQLGVTQRSLLLLKLDQATHVGRRWDDIHREHAINTHFARDIYGQRIDHAAVEEHFIANPHGRADTRDRRAGLDRERDLSLCENHALQRAKICGNDTQGARKF